jgi:hypothetical protein
MAYLGESYLKLEFVRDVERICQCVKSDLKYQVYDPAKEFSKDLYFESLGINSRIVRDRLEKSIESLIVMDTKAFVLVSKAYFPTAVLATGADCYLRGRYPRLSLSNSHIVFVGVDDSSLKIEYLRVVKGAWPFLEVRVVAREEKAVISKPLRLNFLNERTNRVAF